MQLGGTFDMDSYEALESIGSGSFGIIRKVRRKSDGKILARKEIDYRRMSQKEKMQLVAEVNILRDLKHPNIVEFLERVIDRENSFIYILMEYCEGGDLAAVIKRHREKKVAIPEEFVWSIMTQLILALHECHCGVAKSDESDQPTPRPILHRDLKPDNVFLDSRKNVKLGDFGLSRSLTNPQQAFAQTYVGTPFYMSPELISDSSYDVKSDIWSLGCIVFEMCALEPPFLATTQAELDAKIRLGRIPSLPPQYSQELGALVRSMLQVNPRKRPTTADLLGNPRIRLNSRELELKRRVAELESLQHTLVERENQVKEKESYFANLEKNFKAADQRLREMETALVSREETIRGMETTLAEREKKISWEQQRLDDLRRNLVQEQERRQAPVLQRSVSEKHVEPMAIDQANVHDGVNGKSNTIFSSVLHPSSMTTTVSLTSSSNPLERYMGGRGMDTASAAEPAYTTSSRITSRRKTGLSAGRYSLQPPPTYRTTGTTGTSSITTFATQHRSSAPSSSEVLDTGSAQAAEQSSNMTSTQRLGTYESSNGLSDRRSTTPVSFSAQPHTFQGTGGKEFRPTGKYGTGQGLSSGVTAATSSSTEQQPYRRRSKSKSASSIIASLSSASLSGIAAALPSSGTTFAVPEPVKPTSSMAPPTFSFNFTPVIPEKALPSTTSGLNGQGSGSGDTQAAATTEPIPLQSTTLSNGTGFLRPAVPSGGSSRNMTGSSHPTTSSSSSSSSLATTNFAPRRAHTPGLTRFNITPASSSSTSKLNIGSTTLSTSEPTTTATMPSTSNVSSSQDRPSTPTKTQNTTSLAGDRVSQDTGLDRPSRQDYEDFRMEWDGDIPSPFIKKTFTARPPVSSSGGSAPRNLFGS